MPIPLASLFPRSASSGHGKRSHVDPAVAIIQNRVWLRYKTYLSVEHDDLEKDGLCTRSPPSEVSAGAFDPNAEELEPQAIKLEEIQQDKF